MAHEVFRNVGGALCLDFVNTVGARVDIRRGECIVERDRLDSIDDVLEFLGRRHAKATNAALPRVLAFREALYRIFKSVIENWKPDAADLAPLNRMLTAARTHEQLVCKGGRFEMASEPNDSFDALLWPIARSAVDLLTSDQLPRVRQCGGENCGWLFVDTSRNRSRQWCDMADCGNLAKVRRFRAK
ncbi:MAG TPA: ABATE domain-containing protein [Thermoanaerobaculia bacterium]|nr:ABATE domain-containing protein [Thermoanaerobaculia bacterium]